MLLEGLQWFSPIVLVYKDMFMICYVIFEKKKKKKKKKHKIMHPIRHGQFWEVAGQQISREILGYIETLILKYFIG